MRRFPEWGDLLVGDNRSATSFDATREGEATDYARAPRELAAAKAIARDRLAPADQVSLDIFIYELEQQLRMERFVGFRRLSLGSQGGFQSSLSEVLRASPDGDAARCRADPGAPGRVSAPRRSGARVPARRHRARLGAAANGARARPRAARSAARARRPTGARSSSPSAASAATLPQAERTALQARARRSIVDDVVPAVRRLRAFVADEYLPKAPADGALAGYPDGAAVYAEQVRRSTTTDLTPAQIHAIGLREVERLRGEMDAVVARSASRATSPPSSAT